MSSPTLTRTGKSPVAATNQSTKFSLQKHDVVGLIVMLSVISPTLLALSFPSLVVAAREACGGPNGATIANAAIVFIISLIGAVAVIVTMPREGAK